MFIEDEELRSLYKTASAEHIEAIERGLLHLEKQPQDRDALKVLLRATHSLKGDSRMLGVQDAETLVHQMEEVLIAVEQGQQSLTRSCCDRLYQAIDVLRQLALEATTGEPAQVSIFHTIALLMGADAEESSTDSVGFGVEAPQSTTHTLDLEAVLDLEWEGVIPRLETAPSFETASSFDEEEFGAALLDLEALPPAPVASEQPMTLPDLPKSEEVFEIETLRVETAKLDTLIVQTDELAVTKLRMARRLTDLAALLNLWEDWSRDHAAAQRIASTAMPQLSPEEMLQQFQARYSDRLTQLGQLLGELRNAATEDTARLETVSNELESGIRNLRRMPLGRVFNLFPRMVRDLARQQGKEINLILEGEEVLADKRILESIKDPLTHLLRNAIDHGIESPTERLNAGKSAIATLRLRGIQEGNALHLEVQDDGRGLNLEAVRQTALRRNLYTEAELHRMTPEQLQSLIFAPGFSTRSTVTEISGRGVGLDVVRANVERLKGSISVESLPGYGCLFRLTLGMNLASAQALIVEGNHAPYAIPLESIETLLRVSRSDLFAVDGQLTFNWQGKPISVVWLSDLLHLTVQAPPSTSGVDARRDNLPCVVLRQGAEYLGVLVEDFLDHQQIVIKPPTRLLKGIRPLAGSTILSNGDVCMVLNPSDLFQSAGGTPTAIALNRLEMGDRPNPQVLLVEDSVPIRTQVRRILEGFGYTVTTAVDGLDGLNKLKQGHFDALVSDVEMPNLNGLELTRCVRELPEYKTLPIILVTTLAKDEDRQRGAEAGASAYLTKGNFDQSLLLNTLRRLI